MKVKNSDFYDNLRKTMTGSVFDTKRTSGANPAYLAHKQLFDYLLTKKHGTEPSLPGAITLNSGDVLLKFAKDNELYLVENENGVVVVPPYINDDVSIDFLRKEKNTKINDFVEVENLTYNSDFCHALSCILDMNSFDDINTTLQPKQCNLDNIGMLVQVHNEIKLIINDFNLNAGCIFRRPVYGTSNNVVIQCPIRHIVNYAISTRRRQKNLFVKFTDKMFAARGKPNFGIDLLKSMSETYGDYHEHDSRCTAQEAYNGSCYPESDIMPNESEFMEMTDLPMISVYCMLLSSLHKFLKYDGEDVMFRFYDPMAYEVTLRAAELALIKFKGHKRMMLYVIQAIHLAYSCYCYKNGMVYKIDPQTMKAKYNKNVMFFLETDNIKSLSESIQV